MDSVKTNQGVLNQMNLSFTLIIGVSTYQMKLSIRFMRHSTGIRTVEYHMRISKKQLVVKYILEKDFTSDRTSHPC